MSKNMNISIYVHKKEQLSRIVFDKLLKNNSRIMNKLRTYQSTRLACEEIQKECDRYREILVQDIEKLLNTTTNREIVALRNEVPTQVMESRLADAWGNRNPSTSIGERSLELLDCYNSDENRKISSGGDHET